MRKYSRKFFNSFALQKILPIFKSKIFIANLSKIEGFLDSFVYNGSKRFFYVAHKAFSLVKSGMIKSFIQIKSIQCKCRFNKMKQKSVSHIKQNIIFVDFGSWIASHPIHFSIIFMKKIFCSISFNSEKLLIIFRNCSTCSKGMEFLMGFLKNFIFCSNFFE